MEPRFSPTCVKMTDRFARYHRRVEQLYASTLSNNCYLFSWKETLRSGEINLCSVRGLERGVLVPRAFPLLKAFSREFYNRTSFIRLFRISYSSPILDPFPNFCESVKSPIPSTFSLIPHCNLVKSRILGIPL